MGNIRAAIDIGSNSVRLLVAEITGPFTLNVVETALSTTRLGAHAAGQPLPQKAMEDTLAAIKKFCGIAEKHQAEKVHIVATSAVREAENGAEFAEQVLQQTGIPLQILAGQQEAQYSFSGATAVFPTATAVLDVGGGSSEIVVKNADGTLTSRSVPCGAVRLQEKQLAPYQARQLLGELAKDLQVGEDIVSVGGCITTVAAIKNRVTQYKRELISGTVIEADELHALYEQLVPLTPQMRLQLYPLLGKRSLIICEGIYIYLQLMRILNIKRIIVSDSGLLDGLLLSE